MCLTSLADLGNRQACAGELACARTDPRAPSGGQKCRASWAEESIHGKYFAATRHIVSFNKRWIKSFLHAKFYLLPLLNLGVAGLFLCCLFKRSS